MIAPGIMPEKSNLFSLQENCSLDFLKMVDILHFARVLSVQSQMASKQQALQFYETHRGNHREKWFTVDHFRDENVPVSTVYRILASLSVERKAGSGRSVNVMTNKKEALKKLFDNKDGKSLRDAGRKYHCIPVTIETRYYQSV